MKTLLKAIDACDQSCSCALGYLNGQREEVMRRGRFVELRRKAIVYEQGTPYGGVYLVCKGRLKLARRTAAGQLQTIALVGPGDVMGLEQLASAEPYDHYAQVLAACRLFYLTRTDFQAALADPDFSQAILGSVLDALNSRHHHLYQVLGRGVRARLLHSLCDCTKRFGKPQEEGIELDLDLINEDWAGWIGSTPQTVSTELSKLQRQGWVSRRARKIVLRQGCLADLP